MKASHQCKGNRCFVALRTNGAEPVFKSGILALEQTVSSFEDFLKLALVGPDTAAALRVWGCLRIAVRSESCTSIIRRPTGIGSTVVAIARPMRRYIASISRL